MEKHILKRGETGDHGTFGQIVVAGARFFTGELPWRDNARKLSCIPAGVYEAEWHQSPRFGWCYRLKGTAPRSEILVHAGNYCGDTTKGLRSDVEGCILLGLKTGTLNGQSVVRSSADAVKRFHELTAQKPFLLEIQPVNAGANP